MKTPEKTALDYYCSGSGVTVPPSRDAIKKAKQLYGDDPESLRRFVREYGRLTAGRAKFAADVKRMYPESKGY